MYLCAKTAIYGKKTQLNNMVKCVLTFHPHCSAKVMLARMLAWGAKGKFYETLYQGFACDNRCRYII